MYILLKQIARDSIGYNNAMYLSEKQTKEEITEDYKKCVLSGYDSRELLVVRKLEAETNLEVTIREEE